MGLTRDARGKLEFFVIASRGLKTAFQLYDNKENSAPLQIGIAVPAIAEQFNPPHLEILEISTVMEIAHRIDFRVTDTEGNGVLDIHGFI
jgi:hypothetical protein